MTFELAVLALRAVVILVLLVSGIAKMFDRENSAEAMIGFGVPTRLVKLTSVALPWLEILVAVGLIFQQSVASAAAGAALIFLVFTIAVARVAARGESLDCHCFGQLSNGPVTWLTALRNVLLTLAALTILWWTVTRGATAFWEPLTWEVLGASAIIIAFVGMAWAILRLWQNQVELLERIGELQELIPQGRIAKPPAEESFARVTAGMIVADLAGESVPVPSLHQKNRPTLLVFLSSSCRSCTALLPDVKAWQEEFAGLMRVEVLVGGDGTEFASQATNAGVTNIHLLTDDGLAGAFKVKANPTSILVDHDGFVRSKPALGGVAIRRMINDLRAQAGA